MFRKLMLIAIPAMAFVLTLSVAANSPSQAFAKGAGCNGHGMTKNVRGFERNFRHFNRYGWGYPSYGYFGCEIPVCEKLACEPVVAAPVAPVCTTCEPAGVAVEPIYVPYSGYRYGRNFYRDHRRFDGHGGHRTGGGRR